MRTFKWVLVANLLIFVVFIVLLLGRVGENTCGPRLEIQKIRTSSGYEFVVREEGLCDWLGIYVSKGGSETALIFETDYWKESPRITETGPNSVRVLVEQVGYFRRNQWKDLTIDFEVKRGVAP